MKSQTKPQIKEAIITVYIAIAFIAFFGNVLFNILKFYLAH
jgi:hypothetical protein